MLYIYRAMSRCRPDEEDVEVEVEAEGNCENALCLGINNMLCKSFLRGFLVRVGEGPSGFGFLCTRDLTVGIESSTVMIPVPEFIGVPDFNVVGRRTCEASTISASSSSSSSSSLSASADARAAA
jgi:hypothetical protein